MIETIQKMWDRNWMEKREEIKMPIQSGQCSDDEVLALVKQFDDLKRHHPRVFDKDLKHLLKRYHSLEDDLTIFINTQLVLLHKQKIDNRGIVHINNLSIEKPKIFNAVKFACKNLFMVVVLRLASD